ncbi:MAG: SufE family protein [Leptospiraceae bacterium]|nr:SufE family protein [Leptospiraceae bacterium]MDW8307334.1 SufE family protein [Leptospiraceae bacterium]
METIEEKEKAIEEEFLMFEDWTDRYQRIIEIGEENPGLAQELKTDDRLVPGCISRVWLMSEYKNGKLYFYADSDAAITKGLITLLLKVLSGHRPQEILNARLDFIDRIGLRTHLSPSRSNGLANMIKKIKKEAESYAQAA